jgi:cyclophilin family peptidyl-prolyl cis-trans isomerase
MRLAAAALLAAALNASAATPHHAVVETSFGAITIELDAKAAPKSVDAFVAYARVGAYDNTIVHRVVKDFVMQGGDYQHRPDAAQPMPLWPGSHVEAFEPEERNGLRNRRATVAMARASAAQHGMAPSGFFINLRDNEFLDWKRFDAETRVPTPRGPRVAPAGTEVVGYAVFGRVVDGWDVVERIARAPVSAATPPHEHLPVTPIIVRRVRLLDAQR